MEQGNVIPRNVLNRGCSGYECVPAPGIVAGKKFNILSYGEKEDIPGKFFWLVLVHCPS